MTGVMAWTDSPVASLWPPVAALMVIMMDVMGVVIERAQALYPEDPELALALLSLMPNLLLTLVEEILGISDAEEVE